MSAYETVVDALRANGKNVVERGSQTQAQCPAHDDRNPSLSVSRRQDSTGVVVKCHAGCNYTDVLAAIGLHPRDLYDEPTMRRARNPEATYRYPDGGVKKRSPKPGGGKKSWWDSPSRAKSLYLADKIPDDCPLVILNEGEPAAQAAWAVGAVGVASGGATRWCDVEPLRGRVVWVVVDRDKSGLDWAAKYADLLRGVAASVRWVRTPLDIPKADLCDHLDNGLTLGQLEEFDPFTTSDGEADDGGAAESATNNADSAKLDDSDGFDGFDDAATSLPVMLTRLSDVRPEPVSWLWRGYIPRGKLVTLDGDPGLGKSTLALHLAAVITTGGQWPDCTRCEHPGDVLLLSAEDGLADTVRPRLDAAGADVTRVHAIEGVPVVDSNGEQTLRPPTLADIDALDTAVSKTGAVLIVVDVLMAYLPSGADSNKDQDVRRVLSRLSALADRTGCTVVLIRHLNKGAGRDPLYRGGGSIGIVGAARAGLLVASDPGDPDRRVLASVKSNLGPAPESMAYRLVGTAESDAARVAWEGPTTHTAHDLLGERRDGDDDALSEGEAWLDDYLSEHPEVKSATVKAAAAKAGVKERTLQRAKQKLGITDDSRGFPRETWWLKPSRATASETPPGTENLGATGATGRDQQKQDGATGLFSQSRQAPVSGATACVRCGRQVTCGQTDVMGRPLHLSCQSAEGSTP